MRTARWNIHRAMVVVVCIGGGRADRAKLDAADSAELPASAIRSRHGLRFRAWPSCTVRGSRQRSSVVIFQAFNDTWVWDGSNWTQKSPQTSPPGRQGHAMAYDAAHGQVVLFGGMEPNDNKLNDTWVWDGANWTQQFPQASPPERYLHAMAYDSAHGQVVLFGGTDSNRNYLDDTWVWDGANWTEKTPLTQPAGAGWPCAGFRFGPRSSGLVRRTGQGPHLWFE